MTTAMQKVPQRITPPEAPKQFDRPQFKPQLVEVTALIRAAEARQTFQVDGSGFSAAILDTGLRTTHVDFAGRVVAQRNFTADNGGDVNNATDGQGHGTNVAGIVAANQLHIGIAPGAGVVPVKVLDNTGSGSFQAIADALDWVRDNAAIHKIFAVGMSLGDSGNYVQDQFASDALRSRIQQLKDARIAVVIAAGNGFFQHNSAQGMSYPGIIRECISVGAVYDSFAGPFTYRSGAATDESGPDRITPFSQRLHPRVNQFTRTDIFAPGAPTTSSGISSDQGESVQQGTSQATPVIVGVVLLLQQYYSGLTGQLPTIEQLVTWLRRGAKEIVDGDDEKDNVANTGLSFKRVDAVLALQACTNDMKKALFLTGAPLQEISPDRMFAASMNVEAPAQRHGTTARMA
jgi:subtilisin family serine protease